MSSNTGPVLYGLIQAVNPTLTLTYAQVAFETPAIATATQIAQYGRNAVVDISAAGYGNPVSIYYDKVILANSLPSPVFGANASGISYILLPQGAYATAVDFATAIHALGYPVDASDIAVQTVTDYWTVTTEANYASLAGMLLPWNSSLGFTSNVWVIYGPAASLNLATVFPSTWNATAGTQKGDPSTALTTYANVLLASQSLPILQPLTRGMATYSGLTVLDPTTSASYGNAEVSAIVTAAANPNYPTLNTADYGFRDKVPYYPFYTGSQTVYYDRFDPAIAGDVTNNLFQYYSVATPASPQPMIPLGNLLGNSINTSADLVNWLLSQGVIYQQPPLWDVSDILVEPLPPYGTGGTVIYNLTFKNSYSVKDGSVPLLLSQTGPDMSVIVAGVTSLPLVGGNLPDGSSVASHYSNTNSFITPNSADIATIFLTYWGWAYTSSDDVQNWVYSDELSAAVVPGSELATSTAEATANGGSAWKAIVEVTSPWGSTFQQQVYYDKLDISQLWINGLSAAVGGTVTLFTDSFSFGLPMRVIDWIASSSLFFEPGSDGALAYSVNTLAVLSNVLIVSEFTNLYELTTVGVDGNITFTLVAPSSATIQTGSLTVVIKNDTTLTPLPTSALYIRQALVK